MTDEPLYLLGIASPRDPKTQDLTTFYSNAEIEQLCDAYVPFRQSPGPLPLAFEHTDIDTGHILFFYRTNDGHLGIVGKIDTSTLAGRLIASNIKTGTRHGLSLKHSSWLDTIRNKITDRTMYHVGVVETPCWDNTWIKTYSPSLNALMQYFTTVPISYISKYDKSVLDTWWRQGRWSDNPEDFFLMKRNPTQGTAIKRSNKILIHTKKSKQFADLIMEAPATQPPTQQAVPPSQPANDAMVVDPPGKTGLTIPTTPDPPANKHATPAKRKADDITPAPDVPVDVGMVATAAALDPDEVKSILQFIHTAKRYDKTTPAELIQNFDEIYQAAQEAKILKQQIADRERAERERQEAEKRRKEQEAIEAEKKQFQAQIQTTESQFAHVLDKLSDADKTTLNELKKLTTEPTKNHYSRLVEIQATASRYANAAIEARTQAEQERRLGNRSEAILQMQRFLNAPHIPASAAHAPMPTSSAPTNTGAQLTPTSSIAAALTTSSTTSTTTAPSASVANNKPSPTSQPIMSTASRDQAVNGASYVADALQQLQIASSVFSMIAPHSTMPIDSFASPSTFRVGPLTHNSAFVGSGRFSSDQLVTGQDGLMRLPIKGGR